jgi:hypothetical protein
MSKKEITSAIEKTIEEARAYQEENPKASTLAFGEYRKSLEAKLDFCDLTHPSPLRAIATSAVAPMGLVLSPVILAGGLAYIGCMGGRAIYERIREYYSTK